MQLSQHFYGSINSVYNVEGTLTINGTSMLTSESNGKDLARVLRTIRPQLAQIARSEVAAMPALNSFDAAVSEADSPKPNNKAIKQRLDSAAETLQSATTTATNAFGLISALIEIGKWAVALI